MLLLLKFKVKKGTFGLKIYNFISTFPFSLAGLLLADNLLVHGCEC